MSFCLSSSSHTLRFLFIASFPGFQPNAFGYAPEEPPNSILFVQGVPQETTEDTLKALFQQYQGFKEVRLVRRNNVGGYFEPSDVADESVLTLSLHFPAFVEYETEGQAIIAKMALHGYKTTEDGQMIAVTYAKK
jgi:RNA recognition motif-containing protein